MHFLIVARKTFYCNDHKITKFGITDKNSSTAYIVLYKWIDTWFLDSNRRVGVWSLPWRWHILSIPLTTGRGTSAETCGLDDMFPPDDLGSRPEALCLYICIYICMYIHYTSSVIGRIYNGSVIQYWRSCTPSRSIGECAVPGLNATFCYPRPVLAFGYCRCQRLSVCVSVCVCGNHMLVRAITHHPFELGSPNLDHRCKRPWLRSLLFWGVIDLDLQGQI